MTFGHFNRRTHLYLALLLLPWFFMYGLSSLPFNHAAFFEEHVGRSEWVTRLERPYTLDVGAEDDLQQLGARILSDVGVRGEFIASRPNPDRVSVYLPDFIAPTRVTYFPAEQRVVVADRRFNWTSFLMGLHARSGFHLPSVLSDAWAVVVDLVSLAMLIWIASGLYMWWSLRHTRGWGLLALGAGTLTFAGFLWGL